MPRAAPLLFCGVLAIASTGCSMAAAGQAQAPMLAALADDDTGKASAVLDRALGVQAGQLPPKKHGFTGLMLAERGTVQIAAGLQHQATDDLRAADKMLDVEDMSLDDTMRHTGMPKGYRHGFHMGWFGALNYPYVPRLHERLMVSPLAMIAYLDLGDDGGARVEARRLDVMIDFATRTSPISRALETRAFSGILAGFAFEQAGELEAACREYRAAFAVADTDITSLVPGGKEPTVCGEPALSLDGKSHRTKPEASGGATVHGELLLVVGYGLVPHAEIMANAQVSSSSPPSADKFDLTGGDDAVERPRIVIDGVEKKGVETLQLADVVRADWDQAKREMGGCSTPLSWSTLPARFVIARVPVTPGMHHVELTVRNVTQKKDLLVPASGYAASSLFVLR